MKGFTITITEPPKVRKKQPPIGSVHKDKSKYTRKDKHKKDIKEDVHRED